MFPAAGALVGRSVGLGLALRRGGLRLPLHRRLWRFGAARAAPGVDRAFFGDVAERALVGAFSVLFGLLLGPALVLVLFTIALHRLLLSQRGARQHRDG